jgi:hypothetical protein
MPLINVTDEGAQIPAKNGRKQLSIYNEGPDPVRRGWKAVTYDGTAATDGLLMPVGSSWAGGGHDVDLGGALHFICAAGETATISYEERG